MGDALKFTGENVQLASHHGVLTAGEFVVLVSPLSHII